MRIIISCRYVRLLFFVFLSSSSPKNSSSVKGLQKFSCRIQLKWMLYTDSPLGVSVVHTLPPALLYYQRLNEADVFKCHSWELTRIISAGILFDCSFSLYQTMCCYLFLCQMWVLIIFILCLILQGTIHPFRKTHRSVFGKLLQEFRLVSSDRRVSVWNTETDVCVSCGVSGFMFLII